jgi:hypothetical protein
VTGERTSSFTFLPLTRTSHHPATAMEKTAHVGIEQTSNSLNRTGAGLYGSALSPEIHFAGSAAITLCMANSDTAHAKVFKVLKDFIKAPLTEFSFLSFGIMNISETDTLSNWSAREDTSF